MKYLLLSVFVGLLVGSGLVSMRRTKTVGDFFLGNRAVGPWLSAFAYGTTYFSAVIFIGYAGKVGWGFGFSALWIVAGNALVGTFLAWRLLAKPTRVMTSRLGTMTMPGFLHARFDSPGLRVAAALIIFVFLVPYSASVYMGLSYLFEQTFGIPYVVANLSIAGLTALFLVMGGYLAVALTDFIQGIVMIFGAAMLLFFVFGHEKVGGLAGALSKLAAYDSKLTGIVGPPGAVALISLVILTSLGTWGLPQMIQKFYAIKSEAAIRPATIVSTIFALIIAFSAYAIGPLSRLFFNNKLPLTAGGTPDFDSLIPTVITTALPDAAVAIILLLVLSASMSTLSSLVLVSSSAIAIDLRNGRKSQPGESPALMRALCVIFIGASLGIAVSKLDFILNLMALSWGTVAGAFLGPYLYGLFWPRTTKAGAWAGMIAGVSISIGLTLFGPNLAKLLHLPATIKLDSPLIGSLAMIIPLVVVPLVSMVTAPLPGHILRRAYGADKAISRVKTALVKEAGK